MADLSGRGDGLVYIGRSINSEPLDLSDLNKRRRYNLGGGGGTNIEAEAARWDQEVGRHIGGADRPHMSPSVGLLRWRGFLCPLEPFGVVFAVDKHDFI